MTLGDFGGMERFGQNLRSLGQQFGTQRELDRVRDQEMAFDQRVRQIMGKNTQRVPVFDPQTGAPVMDPATGRQKEELKQNKPRILAELQTLGPKGIALANQQMQATRAAGGGGKPSTVREYEYWEDLPTDEDRRNFVELKRAEKSYLTQKGGVPTLVRAGQAGSGTKMEELSTLQEEINAIEKKGEREYMLKKASDARDWVKVKNMLDKYERELEQEAEKKVKRRTGKALAGQTVVEDMGRGIATLEKNRKKGILPATGTVSKLYNWASGTDAKALKDMVVSVKSNISIDRLQEMRESSPTGGALGQVPVQQQEYLMQLLGSLDTEQDSELLEDNMKRIYNIYMDIVHGERKGPKKAFRYTIGFDELGQPVKGKRRKWRGISAIIASSPEQGEPKPEGLTDEEWNELQELRRLDASQ